MKIFEMFSILQFFYFNIFSELTYNPDKSVVIKESEKITCFIRQVDTVRASIGVRIPKFTDFSAFNSSTVDCGFPEEKFDAGKSNDMIKNIIKMGLGFDSDFLERPDPFNENVLLVKTSENTSTLYSTFEKKYLKTSENERKIQVLTGKVTITISEKNENSKKGLLIDGNTNTSFQFNCKDVDRSKTISLNVKDKFITRIRMIFQGPVPNSNMADIVDSNLRVTSIYSSKFTEISRKHDFFQCRLVTVGQETSFPSIDAICDHTAENIKSDEKFSKTINIEFLFSSSKIYEKKIYCESLQIREIFLYEFKNPSKGTRQKRQAVALLGGSLMGYMGSELLNHFLNKGLLEHKNELENEIEGLKIQNIENLKDLKNILDKTELYFENNDKILKKMSKNQCHENFLNRKIEFYEFIHLLTTEFLTNLNFSLLNIINQIPNNQVLLISEKMCREMNKNVNSILCKHYYEIENKYEIESIEPSGFTTGATGSIIIHVKIDIPFFAEINSKTYKLIAIPKPLYSTSNLNHFEVSKIPENIVEVNSIDNRKIEITKQCIETENVFYCKFEILNLIHDKGNLCVNSLFANTTSSCEKDYLQSITNCMINPITDTILYISHVGKVEIIDTDFSISGIHVLDTKIKNYMSTNITIMNGPIMRKNFKIRCSASEYNHFENIDAIAEGISINRFENISNNYGHLYSTFERFADMKKMNRSELTGIISQLDNVNEKILRELHAQENDKILNIPRISENLISRTYELSNKLLPFFILSNSLFVIFIIYKLCKYFVKTACTRIGDCLRGYQATPQEEHQVINPTK